MISPLAATSPSPSPTPTAVAPPTPRPVGLRAEQIILPPYEFPRGLWVVGKDERHGAIGWTREFKPASPGDYYWSSVEVDVTVADSLARAQVTATDCHNQIAALLPFANAMVLDKTMAHRVRHRKLDKRYGTNCSGVFSRYVRTVHGGRSRARATGSIY